MNTVCLKLAQLILDAGTQVRAEINPDTVKDYAEAMQDATNKFPPVIVFDTGADKFLLADGFHRVEAAKQNEFRDIEAEVRKGCRADALKYALTANTAHGLRLTNADKRKSVELALKEWPTVSDNELGRICGVSQPFVGGIRKEVQPITVIGSPRKGADGKVRKAPQVQPAKLASSSPPPKSGPPPKRVNPAANSPLDSTRMEIPPQIFDLWDRANETSGTVTSLKSIKSLVTKAEKHEDKVFAEVNKSAVNGYLEQAIGELERAIPYAVCPTCQGVTFNDCNTCKGRGFVSSFYWKHCVAEETKTLRAKIAKGKDEGEAVPA